MAYHGYLLLAERLRREDERARVKAVLEEVCKVKIDLADFYLNDTIIDRMMEPPPGATSKTSSRSTQLWNLATLQSLQKEIQDEYASTASTIPSGLKSIAITGTLQKMFKLIGLCLHYDEPVLLVGGTGCGKTTAVQLVSQALRQRLVILNWYVFGGVILSIHLILLFIVMRTPRPAISLEVSVLLVHTNPMQFSSSKPSFAFFLSLRMRIPFPMPSLQTHNPPPKPSQSGFSVKVRAL